MWSLVGEDNVGRQYSVGLYVDGCLAQLPWDAEPFDCTVCLNDAPMSHGELNRLSLALAATNTDWIQITGTNSQLLHDAVDEASVAIGRQAAFGDGEPMTSWHDDATTPDEIAELATLCLGGNDQALVLVVGEARDVAAIRSALEHRLTRR
jgi:hypothetical protein